MPKKWCSPDRKTSIISWKTALCERFLTFFKWKIQNFLLFSCWWIEVSRKRLFIGFIQLRDERSWISSFHCVSWLVTTHRKYYVKTLQRKLENNWKFSMITSVTIVLENHIHKPNIMFSPRSPLQENTKRTTWQFTLDNRSKISKKTDWTEEFSRRRQTCYENHVFLAFAHNEYRICGAFSVLGKRDFNKKN